MLCCGRLLEARALGSPRSPMRRIASHQNGVHPSQTERVP